MLSMKRFYALLMLLVLTLSSFAQDIKDVRLIKTLYYEFNQTHLGDDEFAKLSDIVELLEGDTSVRIRLEGYGDPRGGDSINRRISYLRAKSVADYLLGKDIPESQIYFQGCGVDAYAPNEKEARRVDVSQIITVTVEPRSEIEHAPQVETVVEDAPVAIETAPAPETESPEATLAEVSVAEADGTTKSSVLDDLSLRTNLLYWLGGVMNIGVELKILNDNFGLVLNGGYSPFGNTEWNHNLGGWFVAPELRYYIPSNDQWFVGAQFLASGYNCKLSDTGRQGSVIGGGVMCGYKLTLSDSFDMDFTLGVGYGHFNYDTYYHDESTKTNPYIQKSVSKSSIMPVQAGVNLIWKIN